MMIATGGVGLAIGPNLVAAYPPSGNAGAFRSGAGRPLLGCLKSLRGLARLAVRAGVLEARNLRECVGVSMTGKNETAASLKR